MNVEKYLEICSKKYDIIFADPPYGYITFKELKTKVLNLLNYKGIFWRGDMSREIFCQGDKTINL